MAQQPAAHTFGPRKPSIGFWYGEQFLGEAMVDFMSKDPIATAKSSVAKSISLCQPGPDGHSKAIRLWSGNTTAKLYC